MECFIIPEFVASDILNDPLLLYNEPYCEKTCHEPNGEKTCLNVFL